MRQHLKAFDLLTVNCLVSIGPQETVPNVFVLKHQEKLGLIAPTWHIPNLNPFNLARQFQCLRRQQIAFN